MYKLILIAVALAINGSCGTTLTSISVPLTAMVSSTLTKEISLMGLPVYILYTPIKSYHIIVINPKKYHIWVQ